MKTNFNKKTGETTWELEKLNQKIVYVVGNVLVWYLVASIIIGIIVDAVNAY